MMRRNVKYNNNNNADWSNEERRKKEEKTMKKKEKKRTQRNNKLNCLFEIARKLADDLREKICQIVFC